VIIQYKRKQRLDSFLKPRLDQLMGANRNYEKAKEYFDQSLTQKEFLKPQIKELVSSLNN